MGSVDFGRRDGVGGRAYNVFLLFGFKTPNFESLIIMGLDVETVLMITWVFLVVLMVISNSQKQSKVEEPKEKEKPTVVHNMTLRSHDKEVFNKQ